MKTLLVVDDEPFTLKLMEDLLRDDDWRIVNETIIENLPAKVQEEAPAAIVLNVGLRKTQGEAAFEAVHTAGPKIPTIVYCPTNMSRVGRDMVDQGAFWCLVMPLNTTDLKHALDLAMQLEGYRKKTEQTHRDFQQLEEGIARVSAPLRDSFPASFTFEQDALIQGIIELLADILEVEIVSLMLLDSLTGELRIKAAKGLDGTVIRNSVRKLGQGIAGSVAKEGRPLFIRDVDRDPKYAESAFYDQYSTKSLICVPLKTGDRVVGVLSANNKWSGAAFDEHDLYMLTIFSHLFVLTLQNAQLHFDRESALTKEANLSALNRKLVESLELKTLTHALLIQCAVMFDTNSGLLFLRSEQSDELTVYSLSDSGFVESRLSASLFSYWSESRTRPISGQSVDDPRGSRVLKGIVKEDVASWLSVPMFVKDRLTGSLEVTTRVPRQFNKTDVAMLDRVAQQASLAINNARLYEKLLHSLHEIMEARKEVERMRRDQFL